MGVFKCDEDVFDMWFLLVFVLFLLFGWLNEMFELKYFLLLLVFVIGFDIIFFWVVWMVMMIMYFIGKVLFYIVYMYGFVCDVEGQKMLKSKGNMFDLIDIVDGIDFELLVVKCMMGLMNLKQVVIIEKKMCKEFLDGIFVFGIDVLCFMMVLMVMFGCNVNFDFVCCEGYCNFCNKLWNVMCFVLMNCEGYDCGNDKLEVCGVGDCGFGGYFDFFVVDCWIVLFLQCIEVDIVKGFVDYCFDNIVSSIYKFVWDEYCDWYFEFVKVQIQNGMLEQQCVICCMLLCVLEMVLCFVYLVILFIIEVFWQKVVLFVGCYLQGKVEGEVLLMMQVYLVVNLQKFDEVFEQWVVDLKVIVDVCCNLCGEMNLLLVIKVLLFVVGDVECLCLFVLYVQVFVCLLEVQIFVDEVVFDKEVYGVLIVIVGLNKLVLKVEIDVVVECECLLKEIMCLMGEIVKCNVKFGNEVFVVKVLLVVVEQEQKCVVEFQCMFEKLCVQFDWLFV